MVDINKKTPHRSAGVFCRMMLFFEFDIGKRDVVFFRYVGS